VPVTVWRSLVRRRLATARRQERRSASTAVLQGTKVWRPPRRRPPPGEGHYNPSACLPALPELVDACGQGAVVLLVVGERDSEAKKVGAHSPTKMPHRSARATPVPGSALRESAQAATVWMAARRELGARRANCAFAMNWDGKGGYAADGACKGQGEARRSRTARSAIDGRRHLHPGLRLSGCRSAVLRPRVAAAARFLREAARGFRARLVTPRLNSTRSVERVSE
jgi:hypothetical protein